MRIVFASLGSLGDLHPLLALASAARARGHTPVIAASTPYREYVEALGFLFCRIRPDLEPKPASVAHLSHARRGPGRLLREEVFPRVRETYEDLTAATRGADVLVVGELLYVAPLVAAKLGLPWANVILSPSSFLSAYDPCVLAPAPALHALRHFGSWPHRAIFAWGRVLTSRWGAPLARLRRELRLPDSTSAVFDGKHSPRLVLTLFPEFLAAPQVDWPDQVVQTGFSFFSQPAQSSAAKDLESFLASGPAPIIFTLGSTAVHIGRNFYQAASDAARLLGRRAILLLGNNPRPPVSPGVLALDYVPLASLLPHGAAVVHHGGIGSCAEALRAGRLSLIVPFGYDQPDNAERMRRLGVARILPRHRVSAQTIAAGLKALLADPNATRRARELAAGMRPETDLRHSLEAIENLVRPGRTRTIGFSGTMPQPSGLVDPIMHL